jgi:hypothetical protein
MGFHTTRLSELYVFGGLDSVEDRKYFLRRMSVEFNPLDSRNTTGARYN